MRHRFAALLDLPDALKNFYTAVSRGASSRGHPDREVRVRGLKIGHVALHVRNLEEAIAFFEMPGAEVTSIDRLPRGRTAIGQQTR
jgi:hypothetical protein